MAEKKEYKVVGTRPIRHDGVDKVTGRAPLWGGFSGGWTVARQSFAQSPRPCTD